MGSIYSPDAVTTVTTFYRHKNTDSSDSEDYVLIDLDGDDNKLEDSIPTFLPQTTASVAARKVSAASGWTAIHHNPAEYSPKLQAKQALDMVDRDVLTLGPRQISSVCLVHSRCVFSICALLSHRLGSTIKKRVIRRGNHLGSTHINA